MFLLNSCLSLFSAAPSGAPLLPKLRGHFAEFLSNASSVSLRILSSSTCVGLRYGYLHNDSGFSWRLGSDSSLLLFGSHHVFVLNDGFAYRSTIPLGPVSSFPVILPLRVPTFLCAGSTGISTSCPSTTPLGLALGPDFPRADQLYSGNLRYSAGRILTFLSLLIPAFSLLSSPRLLSVPLRSANNAPLPMQSHPMASVACFSPGHFRRRASRLVSYYALFECMAASEPTS